MYEKYFGFKERPFQLVPNPVYLFLSKSHEEALAHLTYAVSQGDGFVEITGEVGTGKTTLCRVFLDNLGEDVSAAYIFNPLLTPLDLLRAINDEFGISSEGDNRKDLIDRLNRFLMERRQSGKKVILLIDEAQNLNREVLEQLRLLSNLETSTSKLIQIILVGQPELRELLESHELRQLKQRITLSCHIVPLDFHETAAYIRHRVRIASLREPVKFSRSAIAAVYRYSGGIPRRINIVCDRSMLGAYARNKRRITGAVARAAVRELTVRGDAARWGIPGGWRLAGGLLLAVLMAGGYWWFPRRSPEGNAVTPPPTVERPALAAPAPPPVPPAAPPSVVMTPPSSTDRVAPDTALPLPASPPISEPAVVSLSPASDEISAPASPEPPSERSGEAERPVLTISLSDYLRAADPVTSRHGAMLAVMRAWQTVADIAPGLDEIVESPAFFQMAAQRNAFSLYPVNGDFLTVRILNLPAVLELISGGTGGAARKTVYLALSRIMPQGVRLSDGDSLLEVSFETLSTHWTGAAYIPWKNFYGLNGVLPRDATRESVMTLQMMLREIGARQIDIHGRYDDVTREAIRIIQRRRGVGVDGTVGPVTKILLYNEMPSLEIPHIGPAGEKS